MRANPVVGRIQGGQGFFPMPLARLPIAVRAAALLAALAALHAGAAQTIIVAPGGPPGTLAEALDRAGDGDTVAVLPGTYRGETAVIVHKRLTIRGIGARPVFVADGQVAEGKAIWVVRDGTVDIENIEFRGARASDRNGAGVRFEKGRLTVRRCAFVDNQNGILAANFPDSELNIEDSEFAELPEQDGRNHLLYAGAIARLSVRGSRFHRGALGHLIKSRARETVLAYNLIHDGPAGNASYEVDLPNGGDALLIGNVLGKGQRRDNPVLVSYGSEGPRWPRNRLRLAHNTLVNDGWAPAWFLRVWGDRLATEVEVRALNNLSVGIGSFALTARGRFDGNWPATLGMLAGPEVLDFALAPGSWLRGRVDDPALAGAEFVPRFEFRLPVGTVPLLPPEAWSPGAFQR
jgi:hypothetical protein